MGVQHMVHVPHGPHREFQNPCGGSWTDHQVLNLDHVIHP